MKMWQYGRLYDKIGAEMVDLAKINYEAL